MERRAWPQHWLRAIYLLLLTASCFGAVAKHSTTPFTREVVHVALEPLIDEAARYPSRFATDIAHPVSIETAGSWATERDTALWHYTAQIPGAVSMSFHAGRVMLPRNSTLTVRTGNATYTYHAADIRRGELWSRIAAGDTLEFVLSVPASSQQAAVFEISSFQAGFRAFGGRANHPHYTRIMRAQAAAAPSTCAENFVCNLTTQNQPAGQATVALTVANVDQCTGTLINDVRGDGIPYVITARHCQTGKYGGGNPGAASSVGVYWDATTPCGSVLGSIYDSGTAGQMGAVTVVEQEDLWLINLDTNPPVADAFFAGFDASGGSVQGGYTIHHALSLNKQFTAWSGEAYPMRRYGVVDSTFASDFLEVVNKLGNIGPGASGSGLFDQHDRLVGTLSLGRSTSAGDTYGSCPLPSPPAPNGTNGVADFTSLAAVWNSTADDTSTTGSTTLKSVLDPDNTGKRVVNSAPAPVPVVFYPTTFTGTIGVGDSLTWNTPGATQCTAGGGAAGDGWTTGPVPSTSGGVTVVEHAAGTVVYTMKCGYPGNRMTEGRISIQWTPPVPFAEFNEVDVSIWTGAPNHLSWRSNVAGTCTLTGGSTHLASLPPAGSATVTEDTVGMVHYVLTCSDGTSTATSTRDDQYVTPSITFIQGNSDLLLGETYSLQFVSLADACTPTGGAPNDGWADTQFGSGSGTFFPHISDIGTYTYGLTCSSGSVTVTNAVTVTVENNAPYATLSVSADKVAVGQSVTVTWKSNLFFCSPAGSSITNDAENAWQTSYSGSLSDGSATYTVKYPKTWTFGLSCGNGALARAAASPMVTIVGVPALDSLVTPSKMGVNVGDSFTVSWFANYSSSCTASGGGADGTQLNGTPVTPGSQTTISASVAGTFTYTMSCIGQVPSDTQTTSATITVRGTSSPAGSGQTSGGSSGGTASGGGGGGGALDWISLLMLATAGAAAAQHRLRRDARV